MSALKPTRQPREQIAAPLHQTRSFHLRLDEGHELVYPKSSEVQFRHLPIELFRQEVNVSLACLGFLPIPEKSSCGLFNTGLDEKLLNVMGLQLPNVQEPSFEQDARNDVFPPVVPSTECPTKL